MKKLMIVCAVVALATMAHANKVTWGVTAGTALDATKFAKGTAYLVMADSLAKPGAFANEAAAQAWFKDNGSKIAGASFRTGDVVNGAFTSEEELIKDQSGRKNFYLIFVNSDSSQFAISSVTKGISFSTTSESSSPAIWTTSQMSTYATGGGSDVPEPTTGILMLVGLAGLALRRKQA